MKHLIIFAAGIAAALLLALNTASSLTMNQFMRICESSLTKCPENPILNAYVGGSLDAIATLSEETRYLKKFYCEDTSTLFDVKKIIGFMQKHHADYASKNAMLLVVRYLEEYGGCR